MREKLVASVLAALLASVAQAGEVKVHNWPCAFVPQTIPDCEIPVLMDIDLAYLLPFRIFGGPLKLEPIGFGTYEGCRDLLVESGINVTLRCSIEPTGVVEGEYSASLSVQDIDVPGGVTELCVKLTNARPTVEPGLRNVKVAVVRIIVSPR